MTKDFKIFSPDFLDDNIELAEKPFIGFQGEGATQGKHSVFLRKNFCFLRCAFCDSKFTWGTKDQYKITYKELIDFIHTSNSSNIVFTGGESLTKNNLEEMLKLIQYSNIRQVEFETSGYTDLDPTDYFKIVTTPANCESYLFNISPKENVEQVSFSRKNMNIYHEKLKIILKEIKQIADISTRTDYILKFILAKESDKDYIKSFMNEFVIPSSKIWIQNAGTSEKELKDAYFEYRDWILNNGFNLSMRQHIYFHGDLQGV